MRKILIALTALAVTGCAGDTSVVRTGPDTFMVAKHGVMGWSSGPAQKAAAYSEADQYCAQKGEVIKPISSTDSGPGGFGKISSAEVDFRCVSR